MEVAVADRLLTVRRNIKTPIRIRRWKSGIPEERGKSETLSEQGIRLVRTLSVTRLVGRTRTIRPAKKPLLSPHHRSP